MIVCVYSDLHANLPAMESMVASAGHVDAWICLGDSVGLFPCVNEVLDRQRECVAMAVCGDHERKLLSGEPIAESYTGTQSLALQRQVLSRTNWDYLAGLPEAGDLEIGGLRLYVCHYLTPSHELGPGKYLFDLAELDRRFTGYDYVLFGHTHLPAMLHGRATVLLNPGSAGFPVDVAGQASALRLDTERRTCDMVRFSFATAPLIERVRREHYNGKLADYLENGNRWR